MQWGSTTRKENDTYFNKLDASLTTHQSGVNSFDLTIRDIYMGIDVSDRNYKCYQYLDYIKPQTTNVSAALSAPGWTWKRLSDGTKWSDWWASDQQFWVGPAPSGQSKAYKPITSYFSNHASPNPLYSPFLTSFGPGIG